MGLFLALMDALLIMGVLVIFSPLLFLMLIMAVYLEFSFTEVHERFKNQKD
jgi:hypothetical protein